MDEHIKQRLEQEAAEGGAEATGSAPAAGKKEEKKGDKKDAKKKEDPKGAAPKAVEVEDPDMPLYDCHLLIESDFRRIKLESKAEKKLGGVKKKASGAPQPAAKEGESAEDKTAKRLAQLLQQYNVITATKSTLAVKVGLNQPEVAAEEAKDETEKAESPPLEEKGKKKK